MTEDRGLIFERNWAASVGKQNTKIHYQPRGE